MRVYLLADDAQFGAQSLDRKGFEHIADNVVLYCLLGVFKVVKPAQEGDIRRGAYLPHLARKLDTGDKGHPYVREEQVRLQFFHQLQGVQSVAGTADQTKAAVLPRYHAANGVPELVLIVCDSHGVERFIVLVRHRPFHYRKIRAY